MGSQEIKDKKGTYDGILLGHKKEILPFATIWMDLEGIMLIEMSHRETHLMISLIHGI